MPRAWPHAARAGATATSSGFAETLPRPAVSLPAGFGKNGLPLGIQVVGSYRQDYRLLRVAKWVEGALRFDPGIPKIASAK